MDSSHEGSAVAAFQHARPKLFGAAYRMLGSIVDAEDILQDAYLRWSKLEKAHRLGIENTSGYLIRLVTRLCIDVHRSAHARRMEYVGPWLPEPLVGSKVDDLSDDPSDLHDLTDDLSVAFLVMLERLSAVERAVVLLKESFDFGYRDIAPVVDKSEDNCRQIYRRARMRLKEEGRVSGPVDREQHDRLVSRFLAATRRGDVEGLLAVLAADVVSYADGGGKVAAARRPVSGAATVARYLTGLMRVFPPGTELRVGSVNGELGVLTYFDGQLHNVVALYAEAGRISRIFIIVNPDKLPASG